DDMYITVSGCDDRLSVYSVFDNLGKGASGAAVQCLNIMTGRDEKYSLVTGE
ncbi:MAG TPA: N-acetyl-gamma-glutamyl-phosphate reductase, partial [Bacillota bacterium]|nr:N-acetyl-gamma-glutamyl-phosphate reductase [Bacillota bacterium]